MHEELSLQILDIAMNSLRAGARTLTITIDENSALDRLALEIADDGCGMDAAQLRAVVDDSRSFKETRRKGLGLGLAFLRQTAEMCDGVFAVRSTPGAGTTVVATLRRSHPDRPPMGDLNTTLLALCAAHPEVDVRLDYRADGESYTFSSAETSNQMVKR